MLLAATLLPQALAQETAREDSEEIVFDVTRVGPSDGVATVRYATCPTNLTDAKALTACTALAGTALVGTATPGTDYTVKSGTITFGDGETSVQIPVIVVDDDIDEEDETMHFVLFDGDRLDVPAESAVSVGTINDDDPSPVLTVSNESGAEDVGTLYFEVSLNRSSARHLEVSWETVDRTAVARDDYRAANGTITFAPGTVSATVPVDIIDDEDIEPPETFKLKFTDIDHLVIGRGGVGTIEDNEVNEGDPWLVVEGEQAAESDSRIAFTLSLTHASAQTIVAEYEAVDGTAKSSGGGVADTDYRAVSDSVTFQPAQISRRVFVTLRDDDVWEGDETLGLRIPLPDGTAGVVDDEEATIVDDEGRPIADNPAPDNQMIVDEDIGNAVVAVELSHRSATDLVFVATTVDWKAFADEDYRHIATAFTFAAGVTSGQSVAVPIIDDTIKEPDGRFDETFKIYFHESGEPVSEGELFFVKIIDNDGPPIIDIENAQAVEGTAMSFELKLSHANIMDTTVRLHTEDGSAVAGRDYEAADRTVTIPALATSHSVSVQTLLDNVDEIDEVFAVKLSEPRGLEVGDGTARGTIIDDDPPPECYVLGVSGEGGVRPCETCESDAGSAIESEGPITFTVAIVVESETTRVVQYTTGDHTARSGSDYRARTGTLTITAGNLEHTVSVPLVDDTIAEDVEQFRFGLPGCLPDELDTEVFATIFDDDEVGTTVSIADAEVDEDDGPLHFVVTLGDSPTLEATVAFKTRDTSAVAGEDYTARDDVLTFAASAGTAHTISVQITDDTEIEAPREKFEVVLSDPVNLVFAPGRRTTAVGTIIDDEEQPTLSVAPAEGTEGETLGFPVRLAPASAARVSVDYRFKNGTARAGRDYDGTEGTVTFDAGTTEQTIEVALEDNDLSEPDETFSVELQWPANADVGTGEAIGTIFDDEALPRIKPQPDFRLVEGRSSSLQIQLEPDSTRSEYPVKVRVHTTPGTATDAEFETFDRERTIAPEQQASGTYDVRSKDDDVDEDDEYFDLHYSVLEGYVDAPRAWTTRVTVADNDSAPGIAIGDATAAEGATAAFEIRLSTASEKTVSMRYGSEYGTATAPDFEAVDATVEFAPGQTRRTIEVLPLEDMLNEPDEETFKVKLSEVVDGSLVRPTPGQPWFDDYAWDGVANGVIIDGDPSPRLTIADQQVSEADADLTMAFAVSMDVAHYEAVRVDYTISEDTATEGDDYASADYAGRLTFPVGTVNRTIEVSAVADDVPEGSETFNVELNHPRSVIIGDTPPYTFARSTAVGTILDDDVHVSVTGARGKEGETVWFVISVSGDPADTVTVDYELQSGTAIVGTDFQAASGGTTASVDFAVGEATKSVAVELVADGLDEEEEDFVLALTGAVGAQITVNEAEGVIEDVDDPPALAIADAVAVDEGEMLAFVVSLTPASGRGVTVPYRTRDGTAVAGDDYMPDQAILTFEASETRRTVEIASIDDAVDEDEEDLHVVLGAAQNATVGTAEGAGTIDDNDGPPALSITGGRGVEGGEIEFSVNRGAASSRTITVRYATKDGTATALDYGETSGQLTFEPDGDATLPIPVALLVDDIDEVDETFEVELSDAAGATLAAADATAEGVIEDGTDPPLLTVADVRGVEGDVLTFQANLVGTSSRTVTVRYAADEAVGQELAGQVAAVAGDDFESGEGEVSFAPGQVMATVSVVTLDDFVHELDEVFALRFSDAVGIGIDTEYARGTIEDNEALPLVSIADAPDAPEDGMLVFDVTLVGASAQVVSVPYRVVDGTAEAGMDYRADEGVLEIQPGDSAAVVEVTLIDDEVDEPDESLRVVLGEAQYATVDVAEATGTIIDNDAPPVLSITGGEGLEGSQVEFSVVMSGASGRAVTVSYATADGTATASADYRPAMSALTFAPGGGNVRRVPVTLLTDNVDEDDETFQMMLADPVGATVDVDSADGTIIDVNEPPLLSVEDGRGPEGGELAFELSLSGTSGRVVTVAYELVDADAIAGLDYEGSSGTLSVPPGEDGVSLPVSLFEDDIDEPDELFVLILSSPVNARLTEDVALGWIEDDDDPPSLSILDADPAEEGAALAFAVSLSTASSRVVTARFRTEDGTAAAGIDYRANQGVLTFAPGEVEGSVEVLLFDDFLDEPDETLAVTLARPRNATVAQDTGAGTIIDNDAPPSLSVADAGGVEGTQVTFEVELSAPSAHEVGVDYATADGTALQGSDYQAASGALVFAPFERMRTVTIDLPDDSVEEDDETFTLSLSSPSQATLARETATGTITDDDATPVLAVAGASGSEGDTIEFEVSRRGSTSRSATVEYATADGTAQAGTDYEAATGTLTFAVGDVSAPVPVRLLDDDVDEPDEAFALVLSNAEGAIIAVGSAEGVIVDTDATPRLSVTGDEAVEGGTVEFVVVLGSPSARSAVVVYETRDGSAEVGVDYRFASGSLTFAPGDTNRTVAVPLFDDDIDEPDETFALVLSNPENAIIGTPSADGRILDDDTSPTLSITGGRDVEGGSVDFEVTLAGASTRRVTVRYATTDASAEGGGVDYESAEGTLTFDAGRTRHTVAVRLVDDSIDEPEETFAMVLSSPQHATVGVASADGVIIDDDGAVLLSVADAVAAESDGAMEFTVSLDRPSGLMVIAQFATADASALDGEDYAAAAGALTLAAGERERRVSVVLLDDTVDEPDETFTLTLSSPQNALLARETAEGTILDDDQSATLTVVGASAPEGGTANFEITKSGSTTRSATVQYRTADGTAVVHADYAFAAGTLTFAPEDFRLTVAVALATDAIYEPDETFLLNLSSPVGVALANDSAQGVILDRSEVPQVSIGDTRVVEGETALFDVTVAGERSATITVNFATADGVALAGEDYVAGSGRLTLAPTERNSQIAVEVLDDTFDEPDETFSVVLSSPQGASLLDHVGEATVIDDDGSPVLRIAGGAGAEGGVIAFAVTLSGPSGQRVSVDYATSDGTATVPGDYGAETGTFEFEPGVLERAFTVRLLDDDLHEPPETLFGTLSSASGAMVAIDSAEGLILDNDAPTLSIADAGAFEGDGLEFVVTLAGETTLPVSVRYATADGTALAGADYVFGSGMLELGAHTKSRTVSIPTLQDDIEEPDEVLTVTLSTPVNAMLASGGDTAVGTIWDDDGLPTLTIADVVVGESAGQAALRVSLNLPAPREVSVAYRTGDGTATAVDDYSAASGTVTFARGTMSQSIAVAIIDDDFDEPDETFTVTLSDPFGTLVADDEATVTILDDDEAPAVSVSDAVATEAQGELRFAVTLGRASNREVVVSYHTADDTALAGADYSEAVGQTTFVPGATALEVVVPVIDDTLVEADEEYLQLVMSVVRHATVADGDARGTILDDDLAPPSQLGELPRVDLCVGGAPEDVVLASYFGGDELVYEVESSDPDVAVGVVSDGVLSVLPVSEGQATLVVTATNAKGRTSASFVVLVVSDPAELAALESALAMIGGGHLGEVVSAVAERFSPQRDRLAAASRPVETVPGLSLVGPSGGHELFPAALAPSTSAAAGLNWGQWSGLSTTNAQHSMERGVGTYAFSLADTTDDDASWAFWGRGGTRRFQGSDAGEVRGWLALAQVGLDGRFGDWLAGVSVAHSRGSADYRYTRTVDACGRPGEGKGELETEIDSVSPYAGAILERGWVWATVGFGRGTATLERCDSGRRDVADLDLRLFALGGRHELGSDAPWSLSLLEEVGVAKLTTDEGITAIAGRSASAGRARVGIEAGHLRSRGSTSVTTYLRANARGDWGDAGAGVGLELEAGARYRCDDRRLGATVAVRSLATHTVSGYGEYGIDASVSLLPKPNGTGFTLAVKSSVGDDAGVPGGPNAGPWSLVPRTNGPRSMPWRLETDVGYGTHALGGLAEPFLGWDTGVGGRNARFGVRYRFATGAERIDAELAVGRGSLLGTHIRLGCTASF